MAGLSLLPKLHFFPGSSYVSVPSHPLGASTSAQTYLPNISLGYFLHAIQLQGHANDLLAGKLSDLENGATCWPQGVTTHTPSLQVADF